MFPVTRLTAEPQLVRVKLYRHGCVLRISLFGRVDDPMAVGHFRRVVRDLRNEIFGGQVNADEN